VWTKGFLEPTGEVPRGAPVGQGAEVSGWRRPGRAPVSGCLEPPQQWKQGRVPEMQQWSWGWRAGKTAACPRHGGRQRDGRQRGRGVNAGGGDEAKE
jgi:hypothetical protein